MTLGNGSTGEGQLETASTSEIKTSLAKDLGRSKVTKRASSMH